MLTEMLAAVFTLGVGQCLEVPGSSSSWCPFAHWPADCCPLSVALISS